MMWQEARKQEKKIRGMLVDYKRRAERRKDYYEKIKADPTQFIQIHGRPCKIHLDPAVAIAGDSPANMMSWQGNQDIMIDRFDVRAHLDYIPEVKSNKPEEEEFSQEDRQINYERYRILAQNDFLGVSEEKFLHQLSVEEQFGPVEKTEPQPIEGKKKVVGAAIGYNYNEGSASTAAPVVTEEDRSSGDDNEDDDIDDEDEDSDIDFDMCVDVNKISSSQAHEMNASALAYGMMSNDFFSFLTRDVEEAETLKMAREREEEKAMFSGRKSRRERRAYREKKLVGRRLSPPSYAASKEAPIADLIRNVTKSRSRSRSRSASPPNAGMIQYITSFGGEEPPLEPSPPESIKTSVHTSNKEESIVYKRTVRYRSSRSPESNDRRHRSRSVERSVRYRSQSREKYSPGRSPRSRSRSPKWRSKSPTVRRVRYHSRSRSRTPNYSRFDERPRNSRDRQSSYNASYRRRHSYSKSRSPSPVRIVKKSSPPLPTRSIEIPAPPVITRYYGRHKNQSSSSELELSDSEDKSESSFKQHAPDKNNQAVGNSGGRSKPAMSTSKVSLQERLKKKRQALINRQYKADKRAERQRQEKAEQERQDREEEMRELSIKMRRRARQRRHQYYEQSANSDDDSTSSSSSGHDKPTSDSENRSKTRSPRKIKDSDKKCNSRERDKSRGKDSKKDSDSRRESELRKDRERSIDREKRARRSREGDGSRSRDRSRSREKESHRRAREHSSDRGRDRSRDRDRNRYSVDQDSSVSPVKKPIKSLVDY